MKWSKTQYPSVYSYETKKSGTKYGIRIRYQDVNFNWKEKSESGFDTIKQARKRKAELENIHKDLSSSFDGDKITFGDWYKQYYEMISSIWTKDTQSLIDTIYRKHLSEFNHVILAKITLARYQNFINKKLHDDNLSVQYVKLIHSKMMAIINEAVKHDVLVKNKLGRANIQKQQEKKVKHIEFEDLEKLDKLAKTELNALQYVMYILMRMGWRRGEVLGLTKQAVFKADDNTIDVSVLQTKTATSEVSTPKTESSYRTNRLTGDTAQAILRALEELEQVYRKNNKVFDEESRINLC